MFYEIPTTLDGEIEDLSALIAKFREGRLDGPTLKVHRVPFGVYEQRKENTYMVRIRCAGGAVTPAQLKTVAELSDRYGAEMIHVTTRQELQMHDVALENVVPVVRALRAAGLATRGGGGNTVRNITASHDSGANPGEVFDVAPYAFALTSRLIADPESWRMPRKFKFAFSNSPEDTAHAAFHDVGFIAAMQNGAKGFRVYIAGGLGSKPQVGHLYSPFVPADDVYFIAEGTKRLFSKHGNRRNKHAARLRFLWNTLGQDKFLELLEQEIQDVRRSGALPLTVKDRKVPTPSILPAPAPVTSPEFDLWKKRYVKEQKQAGLYSVLVPVLMGKFKNRHALALADFLAPFGDDVLRATIEQNLFLINIPEAFLGNAYQLLKTISPMSAGPRFLAESIACAGADTCKLGICLSRGALDASVDRLSTSGLDLDRLAGLHMNISGCPNTCGQHMSADLGFFGKVGRKGQKIYPAYTVVAGGAIGGDAPRLAQPVGDVSARDMPDFVAEFFKVYLPKKDKYATFLEYLEAEGRADIQAALSHFRDVPEYEANQKHFVDWSARDPFSLVGRGVGECSAGIFDMIEIDLKRAKQLQQELGGTPAGKEREALLSQMALSTARMLLVTRGVEAATERQVFERFNEHFMKKGLVDPRFQPLVDAALAGEASRLDFEGLKALAETVETLYKSMNDSLRFPGEIDCARGAEPKPAAGPAAEALFRDYRGVPCPMNFVKTKIDLAGIGKGDRLRILLDDGPPIENVPRSVAGEGHQVVEQVKQGAHWSVLIEKR
ncbi:MAG: sulfurtransferase TusA family protein [Elusimicrobia bacterium]|nr:sulfurtransferase TusA family protein [Elusimicrobiota bacterium]